MWKRAFYIYLNKLQFSTILHASLSQLTRSFRCWSGLVGFWLAWMVWVFIENDLRWDKRHSVVSQFILFVGFVFVFRKTQLVTMFLNCIIYKTNKNQTIENWTEWERERDQFYSSFVPVSFFGVNRISTYTHNLKLLHMQHTECRLSWKGDSPIWYYYLVKENSIVF